MVFVLGRRVEHRANATIISPGVQRLLGLIEVGGANTDDAIRPDDLASLIARQVALPQVHAIGICLCCDIGSVVDNYTHATRAAPRHQALRTGQQLSIVELFFTQLDTVNGGYARLCVGGDGLDHAPPILVGAQRLGDQDA